MVVLGGDGGGLFVDAYTYRSIPIAPLSSSRGLPDPRDGTLVGDAEGRVHRVMWEEGLTGFSYDVLVDQWSTMVLDGAVAAGVRSGATSLLDPAAQRLYVFGGGGRLDVVGIDLMGSDQSVSPVDGWTMDAPRPGAQTAWVQIGERGPEPIVFGSDQDTLAPLWFPARGIALGPAGRWIGARCIQVDPPTVDPARVLCAGGLRSDAPTPDALLVVLGSTIVGAAPSVEERPAFLPAALSDPRWLEDDRAVYAQGDARFVRVFRDTLAVDEPPSVTSRARGGQTVRFATAVTFLVGGVDAQDRPLGQWQVFTPDLR
jgi:hypothetical protein